MFMLCVYLDHCPGITACCGYVVDVKRPLVPRMCQYVDLVFIQGFEYHVGVFHQQGRAAAAKGTCPAVYIIGYHTCFQYPEVIAGQQYVQLLFVFFCYIKIRRHPQCVGLYTQQDPDRRIYIPESLYLSFHFRYLFHLHPISQMSRPMVSDGDGTEPLCSCCLYIVLYRTLAM